MSELLDRLVELEADVRYQDPAGPGEDEWNYRPGVLPILLSAPHGAVHTRGGKPKEEDEYTAGFARLVAEQAGAHVLWLRRRSGGDPNWDEESAYKRRLAEIVSRQSIRFVLDIHGAAANRRFGIALGTVNGQSCREQRPLILRILGEHGWREEHSALERLDRDDQFPASGPTVTRYVWQELGVPAAQFELNAHLRTVVRRADSSQPAPFRGNPFQIEQAIRAFIALVEGLSRGAARLVEESARL